MLTLDRRRAFGLWFFVAILAHFALYFNDGSFFVLERDGDALAAFTMANAMGMVTYIMPLFAALPFSAGFCADWNSGFAGPAAMRAGNRQYLFSKWLACALSGGLAPALATLLFLLMLNLKFPTSAEFMAICAAGDPFNGVLNLGAPLGLALYYSGLIAMQFLAGACWASVGLAFSTFCPNVLLTL